MSHRRRRKCLHCRELFLPDPRNRKRQRYCSSSACRRASKAASQRRWLDKPENRDYFRGGDQVRRVQAWRAAHPGYGRRSEGQRRAALQDHSLRQAIDCNKETGVLVISPLQDLLSRQVPVLIGLIAHLSGQALQDDIATTARQLLTLGEDILYHPKPPEGDSHATQTTALSTPLAAHPASVQLDRPTSSP